MNNLDKQYTDLLQDILDNGVEKKDRTGTGTISVFGRQIRHNMKDGFPLLTTKKMPFKTIVTELLWFLRGDTNIKYLVDNSCHIWNGDAYKNYLKNCTENYTTHNEKVNETDIPSHWKGSVKLDLSELLTQEEFIDKIKTDDEFAKKWGELGPIYGKQWRNWRHHYPKTYPEINQYEQYIGVKTIDQIANLISELKTNPDSRRLMVNAWNVGELDQMVLPPCHYGFQVYTRELSLEERKQILIKKLTTKYPPLPVNVAMKMYEGEEAFKEIFETENIPTRTISLMWNQRSVDTFLGLPFNIASYGLLLEILAKEVNMVPDQLIGNLGDVHLYSNHLEQAKEQIGGPFGHIKRTELLKEAMGEENYNKAVDELVPFGGGMSEYYKAYKIPYRTREPYKLPTFDCPAMDEIPYNTFDELVFKLQPADFYMDDYVSHPTIKAPLSN
jgi:thymidylate synthase